MKVLKKSFWLLSSLAMTLFITTACAQTDQSEVIKKAIGPKFGPGVVIDSVKKTDYSGLYEVQVGDDLFYTDEKMQYVFVGKVVDLKSHKNLTQERIEKLSAVKLTDLPLDLAFKQVKGNGKRVIAVFEDPNCGFCKRLRKALQSVDNITIYTFMYDILSDDSAVKSRNVWCSADPAKTWTDWMVSGIPAPEAPKDCTIDPHEKVLALGAKLHINGTPAIFFEDGSRVAGYIDAAAMEEKLKNVH